MLHNNHHRIRVRHTRADYGRFPSRPDPTSLTTCRTARARPATYLVTRAYLPIHISALTITGHRQEIVRRTWCEIEAALDAASSRLGRT
jgi:hypothetical protein